MDLPNIQTGKFFENDDGLVNLEEKNKKVSGTNDKAELHWINITYMIPYHFGALIGIYLAFTSAKMATNIFALVLFETGAMGITAGAHRLWCHRSYKATWQLRLLLLIFNTITLQGPVYNWTRDHRVHHKYTDTMADPYASSRGFFFSHIGWLFYRKHPAVSEKGRSIDMSDLEADPTIMFQKKYYLALMPIFCYGIPSTIPVIFWNETLVNAFFVAGVARSLVMLHITFLVNSAAHFYGYKPYDRNLSSVENLTVSILAQGEGWHNFHHAFPWDYKASELGSYTGNVTKAFIDFFAWIGWAYDLKTVNYNMIKRRVQRAGDGSHDLWGWDDKDITKEDMEATNII